MAHNRPFCVPFAEMDGVLPIGKTFEVCATGAEETTPLVIV
jgi:hypothetical protein